MSKLSGTLFWLAFAASGAVAFAAESVELTAQPANQVLRLQEAVQMALQRAPEVPLAEAQITRASAALRESKSLNRPQVITGTGLAYNNGFPLSIEGAAPSIIQVAVTQSLLSKKNKNLILEAEENSRASQLNLASVRNELAAKTALIYYELYDAQQLGALWMERVEEARRELKNTEFLLEAGKAKPLDVTMARAAIAYAQQQLLVSGEQARSATVELRELTGFPESPEIRTEEPAVNNELLALSGAAIFEKILGTHPEIHLAQSEVQAREFRVKAEKGEWRPRLEIVGQYALFSRANNYADYFNRFTRNNYLIGLSVQMPVFDGFRTSARVAQSRQEVVEAQYRLQRTRSDLKLSIERGVSALRIAAGALDLAGREVAAAQENLQVSETLYEGGRLSPKELQASQAQMRDKQIAQLESARTLFQRKIELLRIAGALPAIF